MCAAKEEEYVHKRQNCSILPLPISLKIDSNTGVCPFGFRTYIFSGTLNSESLCVEITDEKEVCALDAMVS